MPRFAFFVGCGKEKTEKVTNRFMTFCGYGFFSQGCCHSVPQQGQGHNVGNVPFNLFNLQNLGFIFTTVSVQTMCANKTAKRLY
jgi:hypothetical protein